MSEKVTKIAKTDTPRTDAAWADTGTNIVEFARQLERELELAQAKASAAALGPGLVKAMNRIITEGFQSRNLIPDEPVDDYVLRQLAALRQALAELENLKGQ